MRISDWSSDVCSSDLHRDMARPLDHHLYVLRPGALGELAQRVELGELRLVVRVVDAAGAQAVAEAVGDVIRLHDLGNLVEAFVRSEEHTSELQSLMRI